MDPGSVDKETLSTSRELKPQSAYKLSEIFSKVDGTLFQDHQFFVPEVPDEVFIPDQQIPQIESRKPFFIHQAGTNNYLTNETVVPYVWDHKVFDQNRFTNAEALTGGDSGLLALCAVSAQDVPSQAKLYGHISDLVVALHEANPRLLDDWVRVQFETNSPDQRPSVNFFYEHELNRFNSNNPDLVNELLLPYDDNGNINVDWNAFHWKPRIKELKQALATDQLRPYHLRWIEYLSHSVDIKSLAEIIRNQGNSEVSAKRLGIIKNARDRIQNRAAAQVSAVTNKKPRYHGWNPIKHMNQYAEDESSAILKNQEAQRDYMAGVDRNALRQIRKRTEEYEKSLKTQEESDY